MDGPGRSRPMGGKPHAHDTNGFRRQRRGVASVVGALLVLLIALIAFTLIFSEAVPVWMAQNETALSEQVQAAFAQLQATVDLQAAFGSPHMGLTSIGLTSAAVPVLATPTRASLLFEQDSIPAFVNLSVTPGADGTIPYQRNVSLGELSVDLPNRYIPSQTLRFENGAVFVVGGSSSRLLFAPLFSVEPAGPNTTLTMTLVSMTGPTAGNSAPGTQQIADTLQSETTAVSHGAPRPEGGYGNLSLTLSIGSPNACAWSAFFLGALASAGLPDGAYTVTPPPGCSAGSAGFGVVSVTLVSLSEATVTWLGLGVDIGNGGA